MTIAMPTFDDFDGVWFSVMALRLYHPAAADCEILVVDNNPHGPQAGAVEGLGKWVPRYRYVPFDGAQGTAVVHEVIMREARSDYVLCMDCHVMFAPGAIRQLLEYFAQNPKTPDILHGPLVYDDMKSLSTHMEPGWGTGMYGKWASDPRALDPAAPPFEIPFHGMGAFACRRDAWPGTSPRLRGFGGSEGYVHELFRRRGGRVLCLPFLRWVHRFNRPRGVPYRNVWEDRVWNYLVIGDELGLDPAPMIAHFREHLGAPVADRIVAAARAELQQKGASV